MEKELTVESAGHKHHHHHVKKDRRHYPMPSIESIKVKNALIEEGFNHKWENDKTIQEYIDSLPPYPRVEESREGFITRTFTSKSGMQMNYYVAEGTNKHGVLVYFHGGAYIEETLPPHFEFVKHLSERTGLSVILPNYPTIPLVDAQDLTDLLFEFYHSVVPKGLIFLMGDSAGGAIALNIAQHFKDDVDLRPKRVFLISPWVDASTSNPEIFNLAIPEKDVFLKPSGLGYTGKLFAGNLPLNHPVVSPLFGDMEGLPPTVILIGTHDILLPDCRLLRDKMIGSNVDMEYWEYEEMMHVWPIFPMPESEEVISRIQKMIVLD